MWLKIVVGNKVHLAFNLLKGEAESAAAAEVNAEISPERKVQLRVVGAKRHGGWR